ncbi:MAG: hypothetical protein WD689_09415 [Gaiellaceae bacterium]
MFDQIRLGPIRKFVYAEVTVAQPEPFQFPDASLVNEKLATCEPPLPDGSDVSQQPTAKLVFARSPLADTLIDDLPPPMDPPRLIVNTAPGGTLGPGAGAGAGVGVGPGVGGGVGVGVGVGVGAGAGPDVGGGGGATFNP